MGASCRKLCAASSPPPAGSVLDRVISQASSEDNTVLYKLANYMKGGLLLDTYAAGGMAAAERLMRERLAPYMYRGGRGKVINRAEYLRWMFRDQEQVVLPIEASLSPRAPLSAWVEHAACWQMSYRGALGESLLHVLIICDTKIHTRLARALVKCYPKLSLDVVEGEEYLGASSLHLAIAYSNNELVQDLVEAGADVNQRAIGSFFLPRDQQCVPPARQTTYEGLAYLGEFPLAWAACCSNEAVYNLLLDCGADPDRQDSFGNMILHMVVVCDKLDMFGYALRHPKLPASNGRQNLEGFTPLTLACRLGRACVFREMLELSAREFWRYSNITCSAYPLNALDTLLPDGRTNWNSALFIILNGTTQEHLNMLDGGIIQRLLEEKWKTFARTKFLKRLLIMLLHLVLLSVAVYLRRSGAEAEDNPGWGLQVVEFRDGARLAAELGTLASTLCYLLLQQGDELKNQGLVAYSKQLFHEPAKLIFLVSNLLLLCCIPARLARRPRLEAAILVFALPGTWFLLMFFAGAVKLTGPFVTMIYSMITGDMFTFGIIYTIILFGFSQSFFFLYKGFPNVQGTLFSSYPSTWMALFQTTLGDYSYSDLGQTTYPNLAKTVFAVFMVFVPILLLNMLIAMMGNTYAHVIEQSEKEWVKQWAKIVVSLERSVAQEDAHRYLQEYSIGLGPSDDPRYEQRAVMVIKSKAKTRARQRKGALTNWKRVLKVTIGELRKRSLSGEELRRLMWGRVSISSPTKLPPPRRAPPPDCVLASQGQGQEAGAGVGSALASAFDMMAFTHDMGPGMETTQYLAPPDILYSDKSPAAAGAPLATPSVPGPASVPVPGPASVPVPGPASVPVPMPAPTPVPAPALTAGLPVGLLPAEPPAQAEATFEDTLLQLVRLSESAPGHPALPALARRAASLAHVPEVDQRTSLARSARTTAAGAMTELFGVAVAAPAPDPWRRERQEQSDSEPLPAALLGRAARSRRARSAARRAAPPPPHLYVPARSMYLVASESSARESDAPPDEPAIRTERHETVNEMRAIRPFCVQQATGEEPIEHSIYVIGSGSGADVEASAPVAARRVRPKTCGQNRVSPSPRPLQPWATAPLARLCRAARSGSPASRSTASLRSDPGDLSDGR